ncbi:hypothetical protein KIPB_011904, partial [Kipferlia bialata]
EFKTDNPDRGTWNYFSLFQAAYGLLGKYIQEATHSPVEDATVSMQIYREWVMTGSTQKARTKLTKMRNERLFPRRPANPLHIDGVCGAKYRPEKCICGQKTALDNE